MTENIQKQLFCLHGQKYYQSRLNILGNVTGGDLRSLHRVFLKNEFPENSISSSHSFPTPFPDAPPPLYPQTLYPLIDIFQSHPVQFVLPSWVWGLPQEWGWTTRGHTLKDGWHFPNPQQPWLGVGCHDSVLLHSRTSGESEVADISVQIQGKFSQQDSFRICFSRHF